MSAHPYRTPLVLLGLFPLLVLLWGWTHTLQASVCWARNFGEDRGASIDLHDSAMTLQLARTESARSKHFSKGGGPFTPTSLLGEVEILRPLPPRWYRPPEWQYQRVKQFGTMADSIRLVVPFWLMIASYLSAWLVMSFSILRPRADRDRLTGARVAVNPALPPNSARGHPATS